MKKVLICVRRLDQGAAEMLDCRLAVELNKLGIHADLAAQYSDSFYGLSKGRIWKSKGVPNVFFLNSELRFGVLRAIYNLYKAVNYNKYDAVVTTNSGLDTYAFIVNKFMYSFKHIVGFHDYFYTSTLEKFIFKVWKKALRQVDTFFSISTFVKLNVAEIFNISTDKITVIQNSIPKLKESQDLEDIRQEYGLKKDTKIILLVGRIISRKGFDIAIESAVEIIRRSNVRIMILGDNFKGEAIVSGSLPYFKQLQSLINSLQVQDKVIFCGYRPNVLDIMKQADLFLHIPRHEGFGLVLIEAIAAGLPIIASNVGGIPEVLKDTPYKTFSLDNKVGITNQIEIMLSMPIEKRIEMVENAKKKIPFYTDERRSKDFKELLEQVYVKQMV